MGVIRKKNSQTGEWEIFGSTDAKDINLIDTLDNFTDKKVEGDKIKFILLKKVGKAMIDTSVTKDEIMAGIQEIYFSEEDEHE